MRDWVRHNVWYLLAADGCLLAYALFLPAHNGWRTAVATCFVVLMGYELGVAVGRGAS